MKMMRHLILALSLLAILTVHAQKPADQTHDSSFITKFSRYDFKGKFSAAVDEDANRNWFLADLSKLPSHFERVYFMNLAFSEEALVNVDSDIHKNFICFTANKKYETSEVLQTFDELKKKVDGVNTTWSEDQKSQWLNKNDKYK